MEIPAYKRRILDDIAAKGLSLREVSISAGLGENFVQQLETSRVPTVEKLMKLCDRLGLSYTYVLTGVQMTKEEEELLSAFASLSTEARAHVRGLLEQFRKVSEPLG